MYLIAHQDTCQMVVGNVLKIRKQGTVEPGVVWSVDGTEEDRKLPRQCTCEPQQINWEKLLLALVGPGRATLDDIYE